MADHAFTDERLAAWYDALNSGRDDLEFYLPLVLSATAVLDVGCGTGTLLGEARQAGHEGRLCGLDPAAAMLAEARRHEGVEWVLGDLLSTPFRGEFDLVVMTGHAFQVLCTDEELRATLSAVRAALAPGGRFAFETRNPAARAWERWTPEYAREITVGGETVRMAHEAETPRDGLVRFTTTYTGAGWEDRSTSVLRFTGEAELDRFLAEAGLRAVERYGDWGGGPVTADSPELITIATVVKPAVDG
ncbi:class I SAM-dependent methyltransferase [Amycolatopsis acidicola]|uniref:Class I SAM-dependent methyltransferase n=1 Tax=Amycolatopsis acidicola TaxID=2596893 RepID=A0A5N0UU82_9PSEU|nr:class I SAM-dependent methyltransferase [Amycolatopsis acidicola]KAA9153187.1 class I SAM-dependent methyltransferase [Amycolatopsis acidicola]